MVDYRTDGSVAILEVNNPPLNTLSKHVIQGFVDGMNKATSDPRIKAIVVLGKGRAFIAGADITQFVKPMEELSSSPNLIEVGHILEASEKPVICAIHGIAFGGGLEICLFSHYRLAVKSARLGFPEVKLGILPAAAGTQRLPRVTDIEVAMDMISSGRPVSATDALKYGILDKIVGDDLLKESIRFAHTIIGKPLDPRRLRHLSVKGADRVGPLFDAWMFRVKQKQKGSIAPVYCLKSVYNAALLPYETGLLMENAYMKYLVTGSQSAALRYGFFAERAAQKWRLPSGASSTNTKPLTVQVAGVVGAGFMGSSITVCLLRAGYPVVVVEQDQDFLDRGVEVIRGILSDSLKHRLMTKEAMKKCLSVLKTSVDLQDLANVDLVIEAVYENLSLKQEIFKRLDQICKSSTLLCSNTSSIDIETIASVTKRPQQVIGTHFFSPAHIMLLLENVYGKHTSAQTVATVMDLAKRIGKVPILVKSCRHFVANRMLANLLNESQFMVEEGILPEQVDQVLEDFGMAKGPFKVCDLTGIDVWRIRHGKAKQLGAELTLQTRFFRGERYSSLSDRMYKLGRLGRKTGRGWYRYEKPGGKNAMPDDDVRDIVRKHCEELAIEKRHISTQEILERCLFSAVNEGFRILEEGVADKPEDIDVIWWYGLGFPKFMGGPMFCANQMDLKHVYERICYYHENFPFSSHWVPSDLLRRLAATPNPVPVSQWKAELYSKL